MSTTPCYEQLIYGPDVDPAGALNYTTNAVIPLTGKYRLLSKVVYGDDENQVLYHEHSLDVESIIYNETHTGPVDNVEEEVQRLRSILSTPRHQLKLHPIGLGEIGIINKDQMDVKGGPFPQDVTVESIASNNAIMVRWSVMFRTQPECSTLLSTLLQYNVEQDMNVDDDGNMEFTVNITYQSSVPITNPQALEDISNVLVRRVNKSFQGMTKKKRTSLSRDQRIMSIRLVYREIESDSAFFPYTSNIQITDELESSLLGSSIYAGKGFYTWRRTIGGSIRLPARIHKGYAWYVFLVILRERFKNLQLYGKIAAVLDVTPPVSQPQNDRQTNWYLPLKIKLTNPIYSREMKFECTYVVVTDLNSLMGSTNILNRVNVTEDEAVPLSTQWKAWQNAKNISLNGRFNYTLSGTPIVYNQCTGGYSDHQFGSDSLLGLEIEGEEPDISGGGSDNPEDARDPLRLGFGSQYSWIKYDNDFEIEEDTNSIAVSYMEEPAAGYYNSTDGAYSNRDVEGFIYNGRVTNGTAQTNPPAVIARGHSTYFVRMKGHAMRVGYKIPLPFVVSVGGKTATRVGGKIAHKQISSGDFPTYLAKWDILYCVEGGDIYSTDIAASIVSTGAPGHYS